MIFNPTTIALLGAGIMALASFMPDKKKDTPTPEKSGDTIIHNHIYGDPQNAAIPATSKNKKANTSDPQSQKGRETPPKQQGINLPERIDVDEEPPKSDETDKENDK
jgi:hypothetical protein